MLVIHNSLQCILSKCTLLLKPPLWTLKEATVQLVQIQVRPLRPPPRRVVGVLVIQLQLSEAQEASSSLRPPRGPEKCQRFVDVLDATIQSNVVQMVGIVTIVLMNVSWVSAAKSIPTGHLVLLRNHHHHHRNHNHNMCKFPTHR